MYFEIQHFPAQENEFHHSDTIHHVEYDYYGKRIATCSIDKAVCIWDRTPNGWVKTAFWKKHGSAVWRVRFAHPEFGQILATCSFDNTLQIFDKDASESADQISHAGVHMGRGDASNGWTRRANLNAYGNVLDIGFAPSCYGLKLACCTANGKLMIWEADDIMSTDIWNNSFCLDVISHRLSSLSWSLNLNRYDSPIIAVSSDDVGAPANDKLTLFTFNFSGFSGGTVKIARQKFELEDQVKCVMFGPSLGYTYHKLAVAAGSKIYIYHLQATTDEFRSQKTVTVSGGGIGSSIGTNAPSDFDVTISSCYVLNESNSQILTSLVVRVSWNILGDVLSAVYADGVTRIWKYVFSNKWVLIGEIPPPEPHSELNGRDNNIYY